ncbi:hypothetical protein Poli38472_007114 [Pythium oligandrum]|uniref:Uncharacterized protein n=1 Tax=Pythium oligandrum TaxID=41045 RepID=A0A8K1C9J3_PYTOL|nr:hypothetical protein Poli38472_007114 [Pythium oligandrum]|eukprot:TMW58969.1 hypothetical protein Poli38472_007114 [Pythium oligandrum]
MMETRHTASSGANGAHAAGLMDTHDVAHDGSSPRSESAHSGDGSDSQATNARNGTSTPQNGGNAGSTGSRKRIFTFQKRWLHSLPIMEKTLPESAMDSAAMALKGSNVLGEDGNVSRDVVVCMLCDDPNSTRELPKIWSRMNCRRGRIENHLMSKHPEFMLLLKQKRETEGDLAVQIFLQSMRDGRCNVRNEISAGLYSHMQAVVPASGLTPMTDLHVQGNKRAFGHDEFIPSPMMALSQAKSNSGFTQMLVAKDSVDMLELENRRKRAKQSNNGHDTSSASLFHAHNSSAFQASTAMSHLRGALFGKVIVITGGEKLSMSNTAIKLWLMGANVLVSFSELEAMDAFASSYLAQMQDRDAAENPRGVLLPMLCTIQTKAQIDEWTRSIASKFPHVDYLINYVEDDDENKKNGGDNGAVPDLHGGRDRSKSNADENIASSVNRVLEICQAFAATCVPRGSRAAIVNITTHTHAVRTNMNCAAIEAMTKSLSSDLQTANVQVNCILLERPDDATHAIPEDSGELSHTLLFLLSPSSACISGSVLRISTGYSGFGNSGDSDLTTTHTEALAAHHSTSTSGSTSADSVVTTNASTGESVERHVV